MTETKKGEGGRSIQLKLVAIVFAASVALLAAGYYLFLRTEYSVLYTDLRPADAAAIVAELERRGISHELRDGGATIAVATQGVASARLAIAGSEVPSKGAVGFELFNESDMGLTDFAQRINYQRALQGELARTVMMMGGIEAARVHLALPERSLFRGARSQPSAAVTVVAERGRMLEEARVAGIQRLVAAAVPDLMLDNVVVLDGAGRVLSRTVALEQRLPAELEEQQAVQSYYRGRARAAVENVLPGLSFDVRVTAIPSGGGVSEAAAGPAAEDGAARRRDFRLRIVLVTDSALPAPDRERAEQAVRSAVDLDEPAGDSFVFTVAPIGAPLPGGAVAPVLAPAGAAESTGPTPGVGGGAPGWWTWFALPIAALLALLLLRARSSAMPAEERAAFVARIRRQLRLVEEGGDGGR